MKRVSLITIAALLTFAAVAQARYYKPKRNDRCRTHYVRRVVRVDRRHRVVRHHHVSWVITRKHGRPVTFRQVRCVYVKPKGATQPTSTTTTTTPSATVAPPSTTTASTATPAAATASPPAQSHANIDPAYTQDSGNNLTVTWTYSASSGTDPLPDGTLSLTVSQPNAPGPSGGCSINVGGTVTGGTCTQTLPSYGNWNVTVSYTGTSSTVAPSTQTDLEDIEPLPATVTDVWGTTSPTASPQVSALVIGSTATVKVSDPSFEGATSIPVSDDLGDSCTATVSGSSASCSMPVTGTPSKFTLAYPGGTSTQSTQSVAPNGTHQVTTNWPSESVAVNNPAVTVQQAQVEECGGYQAGGPLWYPNGSTVGCGPNPGGGAVSGDWPNPVTVATNTRVEFDAAAIGNVSGDTDAIGYLTFNLTGPAAPSLAYDQDYGSTPPGGNVSQASQDCSQVENAAWPQQAVGGCLYEFSTPGTYTLQVSYTSQDANYGNSEQTYTETIDVQ